MRKSRMSPILGPERSHLSCRSFRTSALGDLEISTVSKIHIRATSAEQWAQFLAEPVKHWRTGYSARTLAYSWQEAAGFPAEIKAVLTSSELFSDIELLLAIPEHQVSLPGGRRPSQNDVWALARSGANLVSVAVEGKVEEPFGPTLDEWLAEASPGKAARLAYLQEQLSLTEPLPGSTRYQLLHRAASAVIEAKRFCASQAIMLVHSFSRSNSWFADYSVFARLLGAQASIDRLVPVGRRGGVNLHLCWVSGNAQYLTK